MEILIHQGGHVIFLGNWNNLLCKDRESPQFFPTKIEINHALANDRFIATFCCLLFVVVEWGRNGERIP